MYLLKTEACFDSAHFLKDYNGKCANIHGHRWKVVIEVGNENLQQDGNNKGMIIDFSELKKDLKQLTECIDHCLIIENDSLKKNTFDALLEEGFKIIEVPFRPTAENFSKYFFGMMKEKGYNVITSTVYETPRNCATYCE